MNPSRTPTMRAKMKIANVEHFGATERLNLRAVCKSGPYPDEGADEDNTFARFTPSADLTMSITNPALLGRFAIGDTFYVDFTVADYAPPQEVQEVQAQPESAGDAGAPPQNPMGDSIRGYRKFDAVSAEFINHVKGEGDVVANMLEHAKSLGADPRALALAQTNFQQGAMWLIRAIAKPEGLF